MRELRALHGNMTQAELAAAVGITRRTIIAIEKDKYSPSLETAFLIARVLDQPLDGVLAPRPTRVIFASFVRRHCGAIGQA